MMTNEEMERKLGEVLEFLNQKADLDMQNIVVPENYDYVIESKLPTEEDPTWYRLYKSGWVEQGGVFVPGSDQLSVDESKVILPKEMANTNYSIQGTQCLNIYNETSTNNAIISCKDSTTFMHITQWGASGHKIAWEVKGQGA